MNISVILPTKDLVLSVTKVLDALTQQTLKPKEVIIIDSSKDSQIQKLAQEFNQKLNIFYMYCANPLYPGEARNKGVLLAKNELIAFIDSKTIPDSTWLEKSSHQIINKQCEVIYGSTLYKANTQLQKILQASIYGKKPVSTAPGSLLTKAIARKIGKFTEGVRASEDQEWRNRIQDLEIKAHTPSEHNLEYHSISKTLTEELKRNFIYQLHTAKTDAQTNSKIFIFGIFITLLTLLAPSWNLLVGYKLSFFFIPNITKIYLACMVAILIILLIFYQQKVKRILLRFILVTLGIVGFYIVYRWNGPISKSLDFVIYLPHITKIYLVFLFCSGFIYRALISPSRKGVEIMSLFPFWWVKIGVICCLIDLIKLPGYIIGALLALNRMLIQSFRNSFSLR